MIDYTKFPELPGIYLEDSLVLAIEEKPGTFVFKLDAVLTPAHPNYHHPSPGEQYCYADGALIFTNVSRVIWLTRAVGHYTDASGQEDLGNIDSLTINGGAFAVEGDWGKVRIETSSQPWFQIAG